MKRLDWVLFGILAAVLGVPGCANQSQQKATSAASPQPAVAQAPAQPPSVPAADTLEISSVLSVEHSVDLLAQRDGIVQELFYDQDSWVRKGSVLARLDDRELLASWTKLAWTRGWRKTALSIRRQRKRPRRLPIIGSRSCASAVSAVKRRSMKP